MPLGRKEETKGKWNRPEWVQHVESNTTDMYPQPLRNRKHRDFGYRTIPCILFTPPSTNVWGVYNGRERVWRPANGVFQFRERERVGRGEKKSRGNCTPDQMIFCCRQLPGCSCVTHFLCVWCCSCVCVCVGGMSVFSSAGADQTLHKQQISRDCKGSQTYCDKPVLQLLQNYCNLTFRLQDQYYRATNTVQLLQ